MSHYNHLTILERENIFLFFNQGKSIRSIASLMKRSPSTISRELKRNTKNTTYSPVLAQTIYSYRKQNCGRKLLLSNNRVWTIVRRLFVEEQWSPEEISHRLKSERTGIAISYTTIYRGIYNGLFETEPLSHGNRGLIRSLRHRGKQDMPNIMLREEEKSRYPTRFMNDPILPKTALKLVIGRQIQ